MHCEIEEVIGLTDYFSNEMLEIICLEPKELNIKRKDDQENNTQTLSKYE
jgi:hypothetical protein